MTFLSETLSVLMSNMLVFRTNCRTSTTRRQKDEVKNVSGLIADGGKKMSKNSNVTF
jgi:hypothetical protein